MNQVVESLIADVRAMCAAHANAEVGAQQQVYMKSEMPYYGIKMPIFRDAIKPILVANTLKDRDVWEEAIRALWDGASHREEWYAAINVVRYGRYRKWRSGLDALPLYEHMIRTGAWWDVCDEIAQHPVGEVLSAHPDEASRVMRTWSVDPHMWVRRCSILSQGRRKAETDSALLRDTILPSIDDTDFFSRKAIGWALRDFSKFEPDWVREFVIEFEDRLSPLSKREALRLIES